MHPGVSLRTLRSRVRSLSDFSRATRRRSGQAGIVPLAAPNAADYYPRVGFEAHASAWILRPGRDLVQG
jgi:hypothetical protein